VAGAYALRRSTDPRVTIAAMGAVLPEAIAAVDRLKDQGIGADLICVTSPGLLYRALRARQGRHDGASWILDQVFPARRARPLVTVLDGHPHTLAFLAAIHGTPVVNLGVDRFGQSADLADTYRYHGLDADSIVAAALDAADG
jgi:pyruvate dehydrogenase E1 component